MVRISFDKLQHIYDLHAGDFVVAGNKNLTSLQKLGDAIRSHVDEAGTQSIAGHYRGSGAILYYSAQSGNIVVTDFQDNVIAAFKASPAQADYIISKGRLS